MHRTQGRLPLLVLDPRKFLAGSVYLVDQGCVTLSQELSHDDIVDRDASLLPTIDGQFDL